MGIDLSAAIGHSLSLPELVSLPLTLDSRPALRETLLAIDRGRGALFLAASCSFGCRLSHSNGIGGIKSLNATA